MQKENKDIIVAALAEQIGTDADISDIAARALIMPIIGTAIYLSKDGSKLTKVNLQNLPLSSNVELQTLPKNEAEAATFFKKRGLLLTFLAPSPSIGKQYRACLTAIATKQAVLSVADTPQSHQTASEFRNKLAVKAVSAFLESNFVG